VRFVKPSGHRHIRFPYQNYRKKTDRPGDPPRIQPRIYAHVIGLSSHGFISGVLDTGAEICLLDTSLIDALDVYIKKGDYGVVKGVGDKDSLVYNGTIDIEVANPRRTVVHRWSARVGFMDRPDGALFGYEGFLEYFLASFDGVSRRVTLSLRGTPPPACMPGNRP
jgi:hypothetical protein